MKKAILLHGCCSQEEFKEDQYPSGSNSHWFPWLQKQLIKAGIETQTPEMPAPYKPIYQEWKRVFEQFVVDKDSILVGHSCGAGFLLRWLGETKKKVGKLILVAPYFDPKKENEAREDLVDFEVDSSIQNRVDVHLLYSSDDPVTGVKESVEVLSQAMPHAQKYLFKNKGHFCYNEMGTEKFPELYELIID